MKFRIAWMATVLAGLSGLCSASLQAAPDCSLEALRKIAPAGTQLTSAKRVSAEQAAYCQIEGTMDLPGNSERFRLGLPEQWNGKFLFEATGGASGVLVDVGPGVQRGYATATTDTGHVGTPGNFDFWLDPPKRAGWVHQGVHTATVGTKAMVAAYYSRAPEHNFLRGCSNGGRQGLMEAQRYPDDYDGVLSGAPAADPGLITLAWIWDAQTLLATPLSSDDWSLVGRTVREACDARDGLKDGLIQDDRRCELPRAQLACKAGQSKDCLSDAKLAALDRIWNKPDLGNGLRLQPEGRGYEDQMQSQAFYVGASPLKLFSAMRASRASAGNEFSLRPPEPPPPLTTLLPWLIVGAPSAMDQFAKGFAQGVLMPDRKIDVRTFDVIKDGPELAKQVRGIIDVTYQPDLSVYLRRGAKMMIWHGLADTTLSPEGSYRYIEAARDSAIKAGLTAEAFDQSVRLYTAPTIGHCAGGGGPNDADLLGALDAWVVQGKTPEAITVVRRGDDGKIVRSRLICPMPQEPHYSGQGSTDDARSFICAVPPDRIGLTGLATPAR